MSVDFLLHESSGTSQWSLDNHISCAKISPVGYAVFRTALQPDTVGSRLKEVQDSVQVCLCDFALARKILTISQSLEKFGKMVKLVSFAPFQ